MNFGKQGQIATALAICLSIKANAQVPEPFSVHRLIYADEIGEGISDTVLVDTNGDFKLDLIIVFRGSKNLVVLAGDGAGGFGAMLTDMPLVCGFLGPTLVEAADFNDDQNVDLVTACPGSNQIKVFFGAGDGTFHQPGSSYVVPSDPGDIEVGNVNGDPWPDIVASCPDSDQAAVFLGNSNGVFFEAAASPITVASAGAFPNAVSLGHFNQDNYQELATANMNSGTVSLLQGQGDGDFSYAPGSPISLGRTPTQVAFSDLNNDGDNDLVATETNAGRLWTWLGAGDLTFVNATMRELGGAASAMTIAKLNNDLFPDILVADTSNDVLKVFLGDGTGDLVESTSSPYSTFGSVLSLKSGNLNSDSHDDAILANGVSISVTLSDGIGGLSDPHQSTFNTSQNALRLAVADFSGNGLDDLAVLSGNGDHGEVRIHPGIVGARFSSVASQVLTMTRDSYDIASGDFDGDGFADLMVISSPTSIKVYLNDSGTQLLEDPVASIAQGLGDQLTPLHINDDGILDVIVTGERSAFQIALYGDGAGAFSQAPNGGSSLALLGIRDKQIGQFRPGMPHDLLVAADPSTIYVYFGDDLGGFTLQPQLSISIPGSARGLAQLDLNGDAFPDLAAVTATKLVVMSGDGGGGFSITNEYDLLNEPAFVAAGNFDGVAGMDLAIVDHAFDNAYLSLWLGDGSGAMSPAFQSVNIGPEIRWNRYDQIMAFDLGANGIWELLSINDDFLAVDEPAIQILFLDQLFLDSFDGQPPR